MHKLSEADRSQGEGKGRCGRVPALQIPEATYYRWRNRLVRLIEGQRRHTVE